MDSDQDCSYRPPMSSDGQAGRRKLRTLLGCVVVLMVAPAVFVVHDGLSLTPWTESIGYVEPGTLRTAPERMVRALQYGLEIDILVALGLFCVLLAWSARRRTRRALAAGAGTPVRGSR